ncbi:MAG: MarR family transcriptional regulator [Leucobacter sp.]|nr:MarR family transcriptional regulator [Leucobacter sp.]
MVALPISLANRAWESLLTAHTALLREFAAEPVWHEQDLAMREYDVLYTLAKQAEPVRIGELRRSVLLSQPALSRMVDRLAARGLLERVTDGRDARAVLVGLTEAGRELQRTVGRAHARSVARAVGGALDEHELRELMRLADKLGRTAAGAGDPA